MTLGSTLWTSDLWAEDAGYGKPAKIKAGKKLDRRKRPHGPRRHRLRHHRPGTCASGRVRDRLHRQQHAKTLLRVFVVPIFALIPASVFFLESPLNLVIAPALGVMGIVLMIGPR